MKEETTMNILNGYKLGIAALAALCISVSFAALAMDRSCPMGGRHGPMWDRHGFMGQFDDVSPLERMSEELGLSTEQQEAIKAITERTRSEADVYRDQLRGQFGGMRSLMQADSFDEQAARALIAQKQAAMTELKILHMKQRFEIRGVLTPEQRDAFGDSTRRRGPGHGPRCGNRNF
jgi:protein CpxP